MQLVAVDICILQNVTFYWLELTHLLRILCQVVSHGPLFWADEGLNPETAMLYTDWFMHINYNVLYNCRHGKEELSSPPVIIHLIFQKYLMFVN